MKFLAIGVFVVAILGGSWFIYTKYGSKQRVLPTSDFVFDKENDMKFVKTDVVKTGGSKLPVGFPADIPVESGAIEDSYKGQFSNVKATQYTVSYTSPKTKTDLLALYNKYMTDNGYTIQPQPTSQTILQTSGYKGNDSLSVVISSQKGISLVQISYVDR